MNRLKIALLLPSFLGPASAASPPVLEMAFIYDHGSVPQVHASTIAETTAGALLAAWFGGTHEGHPDVAIWLSRFEGGRWSAATRIADGVQHAGKRHPAWNPVLFQPRDGPLMLFYKVGPSPEAWWGMLMTSTDNGRTWSEPRRLPEDILGPIKNKPVELPGGVLLAGSSTEDPATGEWRVHLERSEDSGRTWEIIRPAPATPEFNSIQPSILTHADGRLQLLCRSKEQTITTSWSSDGGRTWSPLRSSGLFNPNSGSDAASLADGRQVLIYNRRDTAGGAPRNPKAHALGGAANAATDAHEDWGVRWPLNLAMSRDGEHWETILTLEDEPRPHGYAYPAVIQTHDGLIHITYTWNREKIKHVVVDPSKL